MGQVLEEMKDALAHHGVKGMKWGVRRTPEQLGHRKYKKYDYTSDDVVFVSGKVKFDEPIPDSVKTELDSAIKANSKIIIGDAPGADTRVQDYLAETGYENVTVYTTDAVVRNNVGNWNVEKISGNGNTEERQIRAQKDIAMSNKATMGIVISSDDDRPDSATSLNMDRLNKSNKNIQFYDFKKNSLSSIRSEAMKDALAHVGVKRRSGRYPWGSGEDPYQRTGDFLSRVEELKKKGWTETPENIKNTFGLTTGEYRYEKSICKDRRKFDELQTIKRLSEKEGKTPTEIGKIMGINESSVRSKLNASVGENLELTKKTVDFLREQVDKKGMIDVGADVAHELNITTTRFEKALYYLETKEGYPIYGGGIPQPTNKGQQTNQRVLCKPGTKNSEIYDYSKVKTIKDYITRDDGETYEKKFHYPESMDSKRLKIRYNEEGGLEKDGIVEIRRGVPDLSLGEKRYSQVRILVDDTHYIKGMAVYSDDMPKGVDVVFNTNKKQGTPMTKVLKEIKNDPDNPFGSLIKDADQGGQYWYDPKTGERVTSKHPNAKLGLINKRADEGDWSEWKDTLPSQFLGKQSRSMAKKQLDLAKEDKLSEYKSICELTNPTIKKHLLSKFADECDAAAVDLKGAALPGQKYHVIIPVNSLKENEVYAPNYKDGTKLALIRYPHGGTFEIPIQTVNNKHAPAKKLLGTDITDAIGIHSKVAERLSGADFDGDTVMCIPTHDSKGRVKIASKPALKGLEGFDPKLQYGPETYEGRTVKLMTKAGTQKQMGVISNLITDMTLAGANDDDLAAAVRHSMVVIDAEKHKLDYKKSEVDNNIAALHTKYQGKPTGGAATILSRAGGEASVNKRIGTPRVNLKKNADKGPDWYDPSKPEGALLYKEDPNGTYTVTKTNKRTGVVTTKTVQRLQKSTKMAEVDDAYDLVSTAKHPMELIYADYANSMKALANQARVEVSNTGKIAYSKSAKETYRDEVKSLNDKLFEAQLNAPRERAAIRMANADIKSKKDKGLITDKKEEKKAAQQAVTKYREIVGAKSRKKRNIDITDKEWEAIQAGAVSEKTLKDILNNTDVDKLRERAMPRSNKSLSTSQVSRMKNLSNRGYTLNEIANKLGVSPSTVTKYLKGEI